MNKFEEALNVLYNMARVEAGRQREFITYYEEIEHNEKAEEKFNLIKQALVRKKELEDNYDELVQKATPERPKVFNDEVDNVVIYKCPECGVEIRSITHWKYDNYPHHEDTGEVNYCSYCGKKIDWSEENESKQ